MKTNNYIAILLLFIFLAKFIAIEANGFDVLLGNDDITFVKKHCKKEKISKQNDQPTKLLQNGMIVSQVISFAIPCTSQFQVEYHIWESLQLKTNNVFNDHLASNLSILYLDCISPPPRIV